MADNLSVSVLHWGSAPDYFTDRVSTELRVAIYKLILPSDLHLREKRKAEEKTVDMNILFLNKKVYQEVLATFMSLNKFKVPYDHICLKDGCKHWCPCGYTAWDHMRLEQVDLTSIRELEVIEAHVPQRADREECINRNCRNGFAACVPSLEQLLKHLAPLKQLQSLIISCPDTREFNSSVRILSKWIKGLKLASMPKFTSTKIGKIETKIPEIFDHLVLQLPRLTLAWKHRFWRHHVDLDQIDDEDDYWDDRYDSWGDDCECQPLCWILPEYQYHVNFYKQADASLDAFFEKDHLGKVHGRRLWIRDHPGGSERFANFTIAFTRVLEAEAWRKGSFFFEAVDIGESSFGAEPKWDMYEGFLEDDRDEDPLSYDGSSPPKSPYIPDGIERFGTRHASKEVMRELPIPYGQSKRDKWDAKTHWWRGE